MKPISIKRNIKIPKWIIETIWNTVVACAALTIFGTIAHDIFFPKKFVPERSLVDREKHQVKRQTEVYNLIKQKTDLKNDVCKPYFDNRPANDFIKFEKILSLGPEKITQLYNIEKKLKVLNNEIAKEKRQYLIDDLVYQYNKSRQIQSDLTNKFVDMLSNMLKASNQSHNINQ